MYVGTYIYKYRYMLCIFMHAVYSNYVHTHMFGIYTIYSYKWALNVWQLNRLKFMI